MSTKRYLALILILCAIVLALMLPLKDQVYRDDFAYAQSVKHFVDTGNISVSEWAAPTLILQVIWGGLFIYILGFSFSSLHTSVIILIPIILIFIFKILKELNIDNFTSYIMTVIFLSIPFLLQFSYTFQTDIPFLSLEVLSIFYFLLGFKKDNYRYLFIGTVFAVLALMIRQIALALIFSAILVTIIQSRPFLNKRMLKQLASIALLPILILGLYLVWLNSNNNQTITQFIYQQYLVDEIKSFIPFTDKSAQFRIDLYRTLGHRLVAIFSLLSGLFSIPLIIIILNNLNYIRKNINIFVLLASIFIITILWGLDYVIFRDSFVLGFPIDTYKYGSLSIINWPVIWKYLVALGLLSLILLNSIKLPLNKLAKSTRLFLLSLFIFLLIMSVSSKFYWDRYVIVLLPLITFFISIKIRSLIIPKTIIVLVVFMLLLNSLQMNKARYNINGKSQQVANILVKEGISPTRIIPNQEEFWIYSYTFEDQIRTELTKAKSNNKMAIIPPIPGDITYVKNNYGNESMYLNEFLVIRKSDISKIPKRFSYSILKLINVQSLLVNTQLYLIKIDNFYSAR